MSSDFDLPEEWDNTEVDLFLTLFDTAYSEDQAIQDETLQALFDTALFDPDVGQDERVAAMEDLRSYIEDNYGIVFDEVFDWEDYREWYENVG